MGGFFISFEGTEGCGKSTQLRTLAAHLEKAGHKVSPFREPGGTPLGEAIRQLLQHDGAGEGMCAESELLLFAAARAQLTREKIRPALATDTIVLSDRFMDSTVVYQGVARSLSPQAVARINRFAIGNTRPDLTILIDLPPEIGLERVKVRDSGRLDRMERETLRFFQAVRAGYLKLAQAEKERFLVIDGKQTPKAIELEIWNAVTQRLT